MCQVWHEKLTGTRQTLEALDRKNLNLTRTLQTCCKMKDEPSISDTIALVNVHLMKRASCRFVRLDMQVKALTAPTLIAVVSIL